MYRFIICERVAGNYGSIFYRLRRRVLRYRGYQTNGYPTKEDVYQIENIDVLSGSFRNTMVHLRFPSIDGNPRAGQGDQPAKLQI